MPSSTATPACTPPPVRRGGRTARHSRCDEKSANAWVFPPSPLSKPPEPAQRRPNFLDAVSFLLVRKLRSGAQPLETFSCGYKSAGRSSSERGRVGPTVGNGVSRRGFPNG